MPSDKPPKHMTNDQFVSSLPNPTGPPGTEPGYVKLDDFVEEWLDKILDDEIWRISNDQNTTE